MVQKSVIVIVLVGLVACGDDEGLRWHGFIEQDGVDVEYETYHSPPNIVEMINGSDGMAARVHIKGKTIALSPGVGYPPEWDVRGNSRDYTPEFWRDVAAKFKQVKPGNIHGDDHHILNNLLEALRDSPRMLPATPATQALRAQETEQPFCDLAETDEALAKSQAMGEKMAAHLQNREDQRSRLRTSTRRVLNRGFRPQIHENGYEFRQRLEIWANSAFFTGWDHSGTRVYTFRRRAGTSEPWEPMGDYYDSCNHGDCPGRNGMRLREVCDPGIVSNWYVLDGECEGNWMSGHLCNDDTSLQINHAYGVWTGWQCPGAKRGIAPRCGRQFR